jgi:hypothetical protein
MSAISGVKRGASAGFEELAGKKRCDIETRVMEAKDLSGVFRGVAMKDLGLSEAGLLFLLEKDGKKVVHLNLTGLASPNIGEILGFCPNIQGITAKSLRMDNDGARRLCECVRDRPLKYLDLQDNLIGNIGTIAIAKIKGLKFLDLSMNLISNRGAIAISQIEGLEFLNICENGIGDEGIYALIKKGIRDVFLPCPLSIKEEDEGA